MEIPPSHEATGSFDVELVNHGASVHVHLNLDGDLSDAATIDASNHFVDGESRRVVRVSVDGAAPVTGKLKVASAYGAQTRWVDVDIVEPEEPEPSVRVDSSLSEPASPADPGTGGDSSPLGVLADSPELVVLVLGVLAVGVAATTALVIDNTLVLAGALVVLVGVLVAIYLLVS